MLPPVFFYALVILNLLFVTGAWCLARPSVPAAIVLAVVAVMWLVWNGPYEGAVLWSYNVQHGLTVSDLLSFASFVIAGVTVVRARRRGR